MSARTILNSILAPFGYQISKLRRFDFYFKKLVKKDPRPKFIQIGANDGIQFDDLYFKVTSHRMPGLVIEPLSEFFEILRLNYRNYPEVIPIRVAVHQTHIEAPIFRVKPESIHKYPPWVAGIGSFFADHHKKSGIASEDICVEMVPCRPLMDIVKEYQMLDALILQIDTEGFDADVIEMIDFTCLSPLLIKFESKNLSPIRKQETYQLLQHNGYRLYEEGADSIAVHSKLT